MRSTGLARSGAVAAALACCLVPVTATAAVSAARSPAEPAVRPVVAAAPTPTKKPATRPPAAPRPRPQPQQPCAPPQGVPASKMNFIPWAQQRLDFVRAWKFTRGEGVTVATVDSGVENAHPQLRRVRSATVIGSSGRDCLGHGTAVAGIIGAIDMRDRNVPFVGVAPAARLVSVKYTVDGRSEGADPNLPKAITKAVDLNAKVINVSVSSPNSPALRRAVQYAQRRDVLIVAAAGNTDPDKKAREQPLFPASYPGVLSVGSVGRDGAVSDFSNALSRVAVTAPGSEIPSTWPGGYNLGGEVQGTSFAAPFVAGVAALVRSENPKLTFQQTLNRIVRTSSGSNGTGSGAGMINPYEAVTALGDDNKSSNAQPQVQGVSRPLTIGGPPPVDHHARRVGGAVAGGTLLAALLATFAGFIIPMGRRRGWRPGRRELERTES